MTEGKRELIGTIVKILVAVLTGIASALGTASCMASAGMHGLFAQ
ncbi:MAG: smalltalk protein [Prevotellaceae bacterium]|nr:smalltalk protein [Candidatus Colivivens caballi]